MSTPITPDQAVQEALDYLKVQDPSDYAKLMKPENVSKLKEIKAAAKGAVEDEIKHSLVKNLDKPGELAKYVSSDRCKMIEEGLTIPTYILTIEKEGGMPCVSITRNGETFMESIKLVSSDDRERARNIQIASIVIESILLLVNVVGIHTSVSTGVLQKLATEVSVAVNRSAAILGAVGGLRRAMQTGTRLQQASGIWNVIRTAYSAGILMTILRGLFHNMTYWDWAKSVMEMIAVIAVSIPTEGGALILKISVALAQAVLFINKFRNLTELE